MRYPPSSHRGIAALLVAAWIIVTGALVATPAQAEPDRERIVSYDVGITIRPDGTVGVRETIEYDFGGNARHGIFRDIPTRVRADGNRDRIYQVEQVTVSSPGSAPTQTEVDTRSDELHVRIGNPDQTITGRHTYVIDYRVRGVLTAASGNVELAWNAVGHEWPVPVGAVSVRVDAPSSVLRAACHAGGPGSTDRCGSATRSGASAEFTQSTLRPSEGLTVEVTIPAGSVPVPEPRFETGQDGFLGQTGGRVVGLLTGGILLLVLVVLGLVGVRPPPRVDAPAPQWTPLEDVRPAEAGVLLDGQVRPVHVTATLLDLADRGYLHIAEVPGPAGQPADWLLTRPSPLHPELRPYEQTLLRALFTGRDHVYVSQLRSAARGVIQAKRDLSRGVTAAGWFRRRPDTYRATLVVSGVFLLVLTAPLLVLGLIFGSSLATGAAVLGAAVLFCAGLLTTPRSRRGAEVHARLVSFRDHLRSSAGPAGAGPPGSRSADPAYLVLFHLDNRWTDLTHGASTSWYTAAPSAGASSSLFLFASTTSAAVGHSLSTGNGSSGGFSSGGSSGSGSGGGGGGSW